MKPEPGHHGKVLFITSLVVVAIVFVFSAIDRKKTRDAVRAAGPASARAQDTHSTPEQRKIAADVVSQLTNAGALRFEGKSKAYLDSAVWLKMNAEMKKNMTNLLAVHQSPSYPSIDIYDTQSGKKVASYGPLQGFKVH